MLDYPVYLIHLIAAHPFLSPLVFVVIYIVLRQFKKGPKPGKWIIPQRLSSLVMTTVPGRVS